MLILINKLFLTNLLFLLGAATITCKDKTFMERHKKLYNWWAVLSGLIGYPIVFFNIWLF